ncbi:hypothetical protein DFR85_14035 [Acidianus brierleyi]|uniref:Uncharacterized protein n=1 Tax=Acidianus brierleyi TaxID=41673 RepID=A0A2U9IHR5_9CREN|nr:hypothetical protein DFR85_14035 [Acidianus brierleyi]
MLVRKLYLSSLIKYVRSLIRPMMHLKSILKSLKERDNRNNNADVIPIYYYPLEYLKEEYPHEYENIIRNRRSRCFC